MPHLVAHNIFRKSNLEFNIILSLLIIFIASAFVLFVHQYSHILITANHKNVSVSKVIDNYYSLSNCIYDKNIFSAAFIGPVSMFILSLFFNVLLNKFPENKYFASIAIISASSRIFQALLILIYLLFNYNVNISNDEWNVLSLMNFSDVSAYTVILFFYISLFVVLIIITIKTYTADKIGKIIFVTLSLLIPIPVDFYFKQYILEFIKNYL